MDTTDTQNAGWRQTFALVALGVAIFSVLWFMVAALGSKYELWSWQFGLGKMTGNVYRGWGRFVIGAALILAVIAVILSLWRAPRKRPFIVAALALLISGYSGGRWMAFQMNALSLPPIHDIQTDWSNPISFSADLMDIRKASGASNPVTDSPVINLGGPNDRWPGFHGKSVAEAQEAMEQDPELAGKDKKEKRYPPINTLTIEKPASDVYAAAKALVTKRGWSIVTDNPTAGVLEATETTGWFGFKDDVAMRITERPDGNTVVDIRSVSRVGLSDLGANAKRVGNLLRDLRRVTAR